MDEQVKKLRGEISELRRELRDFRMEVDTENWQRQSQFPWEFIIFIFIVYLVVSSYGTMQMVSKVLELVGGN